MSTHSTSATADIRDQQRFNPETAAVVAANRWLRVAVVYFAVAVGIGVFMGATHDHRLMPVHAHLNLLGWVSLALIGFCYRAFPAAATSRLAKTQFWLHNLALPPMMVALGYFMLTGNQGVEPVMATTSILVMASVLMFTWNVLRQPD
ncbi:MAG: cytochrome-c oxidase [Pseudomonadota bacterium]